MTKTRFGYTLLLTIMLPKILGHLLWRAWRQPAYLNHICERFGWYRIFSKNVIWLHAVSVGETRAAQILIKKLNERYPAHQILLTHMTPTGREAGEALFGDSVLRCYLPYDYPFAVKRFLRHFSPRVGILMETEIWFNLVHQCHINKMPLYLVNARLSQRSATKYSQITHLVRQALADLAGIAAQTEEDAIRLRSLGAETVNVTGNLKFDIVPSATTLAFGRELREKFGRDRRILLAASTREGEEALLLDKLDAFLPEGILIVIVPRHPQRFDEVATLLQRRGVRFQRRSANEAIDANTKVVLGDTMGEMFAYYAASDIALIGGSFLPYGAQNLIEACASGKAVIIGPHVYNFTEVTQLAVNTGAALQVSDINEAAQKVNALFQQKQMYEAMGQAGLAFSKQYQGATERTLSLLKFES